MKQQNNHHTTTGQEVSDPMERIASELGQELSTHRELGPSEQSAAYVHMLMKRKEQKTSMAWFPKISLGLSTAVAAFALFFMIKPQYTKNHHHKQDGGQQQNKQLSADSMLSLVLDAVQTSAPALEGNDGDIDEDLTAFAVQTAQPTDILEPLNQDTDQGLSYLDNLVPTTSTTQYDE